VRGRPRTPRGLALKELARTVPKGHKKTQKFCRRYYIIVVYLDELSHNDSMNNDVVAKDIDMLFAPFEVTKDTNRQKIESNSEGLLEESDSLTDFYELLGDQVMKTIRVLSDGKVRDGIRDKVVLAMAVCAGFMTGGITQFITEQPTAMVNGVEVEKFAGGMNIKEEFVEGGLPMSAGIILGEIAYRILLAKGMKPDNGGRIQMWVLGGTLGYMGMYFAGDILHQILGVPDIKWLTP